MWAPPHLDPDQYVGVRQSEPRGPVGVRDDTRFNLHVTIITTAAPVHPQVVLYPVQHVGPFSLAQIYFSHLTEIVFI